MDKNTILAIALSMVVLSLYQGIFVLPKREAMLKNTQVGAGHAQPLQEAGSTSQSPVETQKPTITNIKEEIYRIKTINIILELSNVGGLLHNIEIGNNEKTFPLENMLTVQGFEYAPFSLTSHDDKSAEYTYSNPEWMIMKRFEFNNDRDHPTLRATINITNLSSISRLEKFKFNLISIDAGNESPNTNRNTMLNEFSILGNNVIYRRGSAYKFSDKDNKIHLGPVTWVGFRNQYHMVIVKPEFETQRYETKEVTDKKLNIDIQAKDKFIRPGETVTYSFNVISGEQDIQWLKSFHQGYEKIVAFSNWGVIDFIAKTIYHGVLFLHAIFRSWGFAIIFISLVIYTLTYPLTIKSMASMKKMQAAQPKVAALQKRYKDDPKKLNAEMVDLYRRDGINPLGGCLPFLLQMPIFIGLYQVLWRAYYFQGKGFLWIKDLTQPDRLIILPFNLPFLGNELNILPILMGGTMFFQQKISAKSMVITDESQAMQQKMMRYFFPVFLGFIFYHFASGLSLYFTVFYSLSTFTQWKMARVK